MKKYRSGLLITALFLFLITGCAAGKSGIDDDPDTALSVGKDGTVLQVIRESFTESNYDLNELKSDIEKELADYKGGAITLEKAELSGETTDVRLSYPSAEDFADFNEEEFVLTDVSIYILHPSQFALKEEVPVTALVGAKDGAKITEDAINAFSEEKMIIADIDERIYLPGKALYLSENADASEDLTSVRRKEGTGGAVIIIYK